MKPVRLITLFVLLFMTSCMTAAPDYVCPTYRSNMSTRQGLKAQIKYIKRNR